MSKIRARLDDGEVVLIDGATGTELELLSVPTVENAWCAMASITDPAAVKQVHRANIDAGAELIIANTFVCSRHVLERAGHGEHFERLNRLGIELALAARDEAMADRPTAGPVTVAGSISTTAQGLAQPPLDVAATNFTDQVRIQADAGVELFVLEMMRELDRTRAILDAIAPTGIPVWIGYSCDIVDGEPHLIHDGVPLAVALDDLRTRPGPAAGADVELVAIMHTEVADVDRCLDVVFDRWDGPVGVYAHTGGWEPPNWVFQNMISPVDYRAAALGWVDRGVQIIGGCCGVGPDHVRELGKALPARVPGR